jgi:CRP/FNR family cyclic AMP-dependent transcriptional regulator
LDFREWVARVARWQSYRAGQFIYMAGDHADGLYGLASGGLEITFPLIADEPVVVYRAEPGFWIGDNAELADTPRLVSLKAATASKILHIPHGAIHSMLKEKPEHWRAFYRLSSINVNRAIGLLAEALSLSVRARVCRRLLQLTENSEETDLTQDDLAKMVGVARSTLRPCLNDLAQQGAIEIGYRRLRVVNRGVLQTYKDEQ